MPKKLRLHDVDSGNSLTDVEVIQPGSAGQTLAFDADGEIISVNVPTEISVAISAAISAAELPIRFLAYSLYLWMDDSTPMMTATEIVNTFTASPWVASVEQEITTYNYLLTGGSGCWGGATPLIIAKELREGTFDLHVDSLSPESTGIKFRPYDTTFGNWVTPSNMRIALFAIAPIV